MSDYDEHRQRNEQARLVSSMAEDLLDSINGNLRSEIVQVIDRAYHNGFSDGRQVTMAAVRAAIEQRDLDSTPGALPASAAELRMLNFKYKWTANNLKSNGLVTVAEVVNFHRSLPRGVQSLDGVGQKTYEDIRDTFAGIGVRLDADPSVA
jgi:hypothetical protein